ncbi:hypothetical protein TRVL_08584 [Trypanosoma vivax]|nr:hypothetical protein TRVL_08584 [Trypanosoma vivax]
MSVAFPGDGGLHSVRFYSCKPTDRGNDRQCVIVKGDTLTLWCPSPEFLGHNLTGCTYFHHNKIVACSASENSYMLFKCPPQPGAGGGGRGTCSLLSSAKALLMDCMQLGIVKVNSTAEESAGAESDAYESTRRRDTGERPGKVELAPSSSPNGVKKPTPLNHEVVTQYQTDSEQAAPGSVSPEGSRPERREYTTEPETSLPGLQDLKEHLKRLEDTIHQEGDDAINVSMLPGHINTTDKLLMQSCAAAAGMLCARLVLATV